MNKLPKLYAVASKDELRPHLNYILIESGYAIATDGNIMALCDLKDFLNDNEIQMLEGFLIHKDQWKTLEAGKWSKLEVVDKNLIVDDTTILRMKTKDEITYPDYRGVIPTDFDVRELSGCSTLGIRTDDLSRLSKAIDPYNHAKGLVTLYMQNSSRLVFMTNNVTNSFGVFMPQNKLNQNTKPITDFLK